jgi:hypothetical protein
MKSMIHFPNEFMKKNKPIAFVILMFFSADSQRPLPCVLRTAQGIVF